jgi:putative spermidine/putrescine transport system permease protein
MIHPRRERHADQWRDRAAPRRNPVVLLALPGTVYLVVRLAPALLLVTTSSATADHVAGYGRFLADPSAGRSSATPRAPPHHAVRSGRGYPAARAGPRARRPAGDPDGALILPLSVGVVVKAFAWTILLRGDGVVNRLLLGLGILDAPARLIFTETGLVLGAVNIFLPFMVLPIFAVVKLIDPRLLDAAATLGASPLHRFVRVTLPLTMPGVIAGVAFVFSMSVSMYVIPTLLMGDRFKTLSVLVARSFLFMRDRSLGSTVSVVLLAIAVAVVVASALLARRWQPGR